MKRITVVTALAIVLVWQGAAQDKKVRERSQDAFEEVESGQLTLRFFNAVTGNPIKGGTATLAGIGTFTSDFEGRVRFPAPEEDGFIPVKFTAQGYVTSEFEIEIMTGSLYFNRYSISPVMELRHLRIVLDWGEEPDDLDLHFVRENGYHISYRDMHTSADGTGTLDRDDTDRYGPETITVKEISGAARYECYVHDFSHRSNPESEVLTKESKATVKVFGQGRLMHIFQVPRQGAGRIWHVFDIVEGAVRERGSITP